MSKRSKKEKVTPTEQELAFYPRAPERKPNPEEIEQFNVYVEKFGLSLKEGERTAVNDATITWKYKDISPMGAMPGVLYITWKPDEGILILETIDFGWHPDNEERFKLHGVSATNLEFLFAR